MCKGEDAKSIMFFCNILKVSQGLLATTVEYSFGNNCSNCLLLYDKDKQLIGLLTTHLPFPDT